MIFDPLVIVVGEGFQLAGILKVSSNSNRDRCYRAGIWYRIRVVGEEGNGGRNSGNSGNREFAL